MGTFNSERKFFVDITIFFNHSCAEISFKWSLLAEIFQISFLAPSMRINLYRMLNHFKSVYS